MGVRRHRHDSHRVHRDEAPTHAAGKAAVIPAIVTHDLGDGLSVHTPAGMTDFVADRDPDETDAEHEARNDAFAALFGQLKG